jgi:anti-sigma factor RsiW
MHARLDELLSLRDGAPVEARVQAHVDECAACAAELAHVVSLRQRLRELPPAPEPASDGWTEVQSRLAVASAKGRLRSRAARYSAAASVLALASFAALRWTEAPPTSSRPAPLIVLDAGSLDQLRSQSRELEALLAALPERPAVARAGTSVPIESLEAQVQWLDHQLSLAGAEGRARDTEQLWRDRVEAMSSLVQLRYVEAQQVNL